MIKDTHKEYAIESSGYLVVTSDPGKWKYKVTVIEYIGNKIHGQPYESDRTFESRELAESEGLAVAKKIIDGM